MLSVDFGQAVGEPLHPGWGRVRLVVVALIQRLIVHAEIGGEIDDVAGEAGELLDAFLGLAMR